MTDDITIHKGGKNTDWDLVRKQADSPIITIITSTFNAVNDLPWTIKSIKNQSYEYIQWIVVDGASTDGTVKLLKANNDLIDVWVSEPDTGIYDAWNKALDYVKGDWVQFLGAGDELYEPTTLEKVSKYLKDAYPKYDLVYGQVQYISQNQRRALFTSGDAWHSYTKKWEGIRPKLPEHPAIFHHASLFENLIFESCFRIVADSHFLLQHLERNWLYVPLVVDNMLFGGISSTFRGQLVSYRELLISIDMLGINPPMWIKVKALCQYRFTKIMLLILSEQKYGYFVDFIRMAKQKKKVHTIE